MVRRSDQTDIPEPDDLTSERVQIPEDELQFIWSELPVTPSFLTYTSDKSNEKEKRKGIRFLKGISKRFWSVLIVFFEICILAAVISGICLWRDAVRSAESYNTDNIVYSSDDIVMMLVKHRDEWILPKPENGYNSCCFLDLDFDGSTELVSISYDRDTAVTRMKAYHIRNCKLEEMELKDYDEENGTFDIGQKLSLYYASETNEMLYMSIDSCMTNKENRVYTGSLFVRDNSICRRDYISESFAGGIYSYERFDDEGNEESIERNEYIETQNELSMRLTDLKLRYEWVQCDDMSDLSSRKLAALLLRSYDSFSCDTSGLGLQ